jgi:hypothetical protein
MSWFWLLPDSLAPWTLALVGWLGQVVAALAATTDPYALDPPLLDPLAVWLADAQALDSCLQRPPVVQTLCLESLAEDLAERPLPPWDQRRQSRDLVWLLYLWDRHGVAPEAAVYHVIALDAAAAEPRLALGSLARTTFSLRAVGGDLLDLASPGAKQALGEVWRQVRPRQMPTIPGSQPAGAAPSAADSPDVSP